MYFSPVHLDEAAHEREPETEPALGAIERSLTLGEEVEDAAEQILLDARAVVADGDDDLVALAPAGEGDPPARVRVLRGVGEQVREHLGEPHRIAVDDETRGGNVERKVMAVLLEERTRDLDGLPDHFVELDRRSLELDLPPRDPGNVEEIVDQPGEVPDLPLDDGALVDGDVAVAQADELERRHDGRERIAQLVAEHGEELVLAAVGLVRLLVGPLRPF